MTQNCDDLISLQKKSKEIRVFNITFKDFIKVMSHRKDCQGYEGKEHNIHHWQV